MVNPSSVLFASGVSCGVFPLSIFCVMPPAYLDVARWSAVFLLAVVASGWMPRITGLLHWWVAASFFLHSSGGIDGGDHLAGVLALILVPLTLTDPRRWHWQESPSCKPTFGWQLRMLVGWSALIVVRIQMAGVYLHAFVAKMKVEEWVDGTALWYWFTDNDFGLPRVLMWVVEPLLLNGIFTVVLTWGAILIEILLFLGIVATERVRVWLLWTGLAFHGLIAVGIGLWSFSMTVAGALIMYLWSPARTLGLGSLARLGDLGNLTWERASGQRTRAMQF